MGSHRGTPRDKGVTHTPRTLTNKVERGHEGKEELGWCLQHVGGGHKDNTLMMQYTNEKRQSMVCQTDKYSGVYPSHPTVHNQDKAGNRN